MRVLAIDQGTSGTKAVVVDDGLVVASAEATVRPSYLADGRVEQDPAALLASVLDAGRRAVASAGSGVDAVALANQGETVLAWDRATGTPLTTALVWQDGRAASVCADLEEHRDLIAGTTGLVLDPYFSAPKMAWIRRHLTREGVVTTTDTWLVHALTGAFVTDVTTASRSLLLDLDRVAWSPTLLEVFGLDDEAMPALVACDEVVGTTSAFGGDVPVVGLLVDQQAALLAQDCREPGETKCTYGTGAFLLASTGPEAARSRAGLTTSVASRLRGATSYCLDGQVYTAGSAVRWLVDLGLLSGPDGIDDAAAAGDDGVLFVPALAGLAAPWWRPDATASLSGLTLSTGRGDVVAAVVRGIAAQVVDLLDVVSADLGHPVQRLRVDGGLTRSRALMQAQADLAQVAVDVYPSTDSTALGAAAAAWIGLDPARVRRRRRERLGAVRELRAAVVGRPCHRPPRAVARRRGPVAGRRVGVIREVDVAVIGAGIVGCAVARELSGHDVSVALLEARGDIGDGTSKANTAILHTGFDATPGTLEARLVRRGYELLSAYAGPAGIPVERTGAVLVAWTDEELAALPALLAKAGANGYTHGEIVDADEVYRRIPALGAGALGGLAIPDESIICSWTAALAYATEALHRGTELLLSHRVVVVEPGPDRTLLRTDSGDVSARWVVNAAGHGADVIDRMFGHDRFTVVPRRGELIVFDKLARPLADVIVLPVPSSRGKGVLVSPTIYGNVMLGPTSENIADRTDTATTEAGLAFLLEKGRALMPRLLEEEVTATYTGLRAATEHDDYVVELDVEHRYVVLGGIRSTGLTASMALAEHVVRLLRDAGLGLTERTDLPPVPRLPNVGEAFPRPYSDAGRIAADPEYGRVVCFCERVTRGEVRDALASPIPPCDLDGLRRRTRALMGRCQGFYCGAEVGRLLDEHLAARVAR